MLSWVASKGTEQNRRRWAFRLLIKVEEVRPGEGEAVRGEAGGGRRVPGSLIVGITLKAV